MHLMATYLPVLIDCALRTSEKVPSPFLLIRRYSKEEGGLAPKLPSVEISSYPIGNTQESLNPNWIVLKFI